MKKFAEVYVQGLALLLVVVVAACARCQSQAQVQAREDCGQAFSTSLGSFTTSGDWFSLATTAKESCEELYAQKSPGMTPQEKTQINGQMSLARNRWATGNAWKDQGNTDHTAGLIRKKLADQSWFNADFATATAHYKDGRVLFNSATTCFQSSFTPYSDAKTQYDGISEYLKKQ